MEHTGPLQRLEERIAHLTRTVDELNEVVTEQQRTLDVLMRRVEMLRAREAEREAQGASGVTFGDEPPPPHY